MCPLCMERYHLEQKLSSNERLEREWARAEESAELGAVRRERDINSIQGQGLTSSMEGFHALILCR